MGRRLGWRSSHHCLCSAKCASRLPAKRAAAACLQPAGWRTALQPSCQGPSPPICAGSQPWGLERHQVGLALGDHKGCLARAQGRAGYPVGAQYMQASEEGGVHKCVRKGGSGRCAQLEPPAGGQAGCPPPPGRICAYAGLCACVGVCVRACVCVWSTARADCQSLRGPQSFVHPLICSFIHFTNNIDHFLWARTRAFQND